MRNYKAKELWKNISLREIQLDLGYKNKDLSQKTNLKFNTIAAMRRNSRNEKNDIKLSNFLLLCSGLSSYPSTLLFGTKKDCAFPAKDNKEIIKKMWQNIEKILKEKETAITYLAKKYNFSPSPIYDKIEKFKKNEKIPDIYLDLLLTLCKALSINIDNLIFD